MLLTKEKWLSAYSEAVRVQSGSTLLPTWQHLPAGHMYWAEYERTGQPLPEDAARQFLSETKWGGKKA
jgi:hypothetical protein